MRSVRGLLAGALVGSIGLLLAAPGAAAAGCDPSLAAAGCPATPIPTPTILTPPPSDPGPPQPQPQPEPQPQPQAEPQPGSSPAAAPAADAGRPSPAEAIAALAELINRDRSANSLPALTLRADLGDLAAGHSEEMATAGTIWHNDALFQPETKRRLDASTVGENVAQNPTITGAHDRLMASPGHRANLLSDRFSLLGLGAVHGDAGWFVTEVFAQPRVRTIGSGRPAAPSTGAHPAPAEAGHPAPAVAPVDPAPADIPPAPMMAAPPVGAGELAIGPTAAPVDRPSPNRRLLEVLALSLLVCVMARSAQFAFSFRPFCPIPAGNDVSQESTWHASSWSMTRSPSGA